MTNPSCAHGGGTSGGSGGSGEILGYDQDDSSGTVTASGGATVAIGTPTVTFSLASQSDILVEVSGASGPDANFTYCQIDAIVTYAGGGGGTMTHTLFGLREGAFTTDAVPCSGRWKFSSVPAGSVTVSLQLVDIGSPSGASRIRREATNPLTLKVLAA